MAKRSGTGRGPILLAGALLIVAAGLFGAVFYLYDGVSVATELFARFGSTRSFSAKPEPASAAVVLELPEGMSEEFALRVWQEQADSQRAISPLVEGDVEQLKIDRVKVEGDLATVYGTLQLKDGTDTPGVIGLHRFEETWYVVYVSSNTLTTEAEQAKAELPTLAEVDVALLNTVIAEQGKGKSVTQDIVDGRIDLLKAGAVRTGPNTVTIPLKMKEGDVERSADLIAIKSDSNGKEFWLLARFDETGSAAK